MGPSAHTLNRCIETIDSRPSTCLCKPSLDYMPFLVQSVWVTGSPASLHFPCSLTEVIRIIIPQWRSSPAQVRSNDHCSRSEPILLYCGSKSGVLFYEAITADQSSLWSHTIEDRLFYEFYYYRFNLNETKSLVVCLSRLNLLVVWRSQPPISILGCFLDTL